MSLAGALQEYLDDPNFEDNRLEYKSNKKASDKASRRPAGKESKKTSCKSKPFTSLWYRSDFFFSDYLLRYLSDIERAQGWFKFQHQPSDKQPEGCDRFLCCHRIRTATYVPPFCSKVSRGSLRVYTSIDPASSAVFPGPGNPFSQMGGPQFTGIPQVMAQPTGFMMPQHTVTPSNVNPFGQFLSPQQQQSASLGSRPMSAFIPQQQTGFPQQTQQNAFLQPQHTAFLQPQSTGMNPFRQSMLLPQSTGMALFANTQPTGNQGPSFGQNLFAQNTGMFASPSSNGPSFNNNSSMFSQPVAAPSGIAASTSAFNPSSSNAAIKDVPNRPASTPLTSMSNSFAPAQPVKTHQTGTKNPFGPVITAPPPVPKVPTLMDLAMGQQMGQAAGNNGQQANGQQQQQPAAQPQQPQQTGAFNWSSSALSAGATDISSIASSFTKTGQTPSNNTATSPTSAPSTSSPFSSNPPFSSTLTSQPTGATPLTSQATGFAGLKPFKPSSSFGASLLESLPNVNGQPTGASSTQNTGNPSSLAPNPTGVPSFNITSSQSTPFGNTSTPTSNPQPQSTPSFSTSSPQSTPSFGTNSQQPSPFNSGTQPSTSTPNFGALNSQPTGLSGGFKPTSAFGASLMQNTGNTSSSLGVGLRPQITGGGSSNPFRASMATGDGGMFGSGAAPPVPGLPSQFTGMPFGQPPPQQQQQQQPFNGATPFSSAFNTNQNQQQNSTASLI